MSETNNQRLAFVQQGKSWMPAFVGMTGLAGMTWPHRRWMKP
jgi:hypothetical protein